MSLESTIGDLVSKTTLLLDYFGSKKAGIDSAVAAAIAAVPVNKKVLYIHQTAGLDTNDGSSGAPLKTIEKAVAMTPVGGVLSIRLLSDYDMAPTILSVEGISIEMRTDTIAVRRALRACYFKSPTDASVNLLSCFSANLGAEFSFRDITFELPSAPSQGSFSGGDNSLIKVNATSPATMLPVKLVNCDVVDKPGATAFLTSSSTSALLLAVTGTTFPVGFSGRYSAAIPAGTSSVTVPHLVTNIPVM